MSQLKEIREKIVVGLSEVVEANKEKIKEAYNIVMKLEHLARREGLLALEYEMEFLPREIPLCNELIEMVEMVVDGTDSEILDELMTIKFFAQDHYTGIDALLYFLYGRSMMVIQSGRSHIMIENLFNAILPSEILNFKQKQLQQQEAKKQKILEWKNTLTEEEKQLISQISMELKGLSEEEWKIIVSSKGLYRFDKILPYLEEEVHSLSKKYMNDYRYYVIMTEPSSITEQEIKELKEELKKTLDELRNQQEENVILDDILKCSDEQIQLLLRNIDIGTLAVALKGAKEEVERCFYRNMSLRLKYMLQEDMEYMGPVRKCEVEDAQRKIMGIWKKLGFKFVIQLSEKK